MNIELTALYHDQVPLSREVSNLKDDIIRLRRALNEKNLPTIDTYLKAGKRALRVGGIALTAISALYGANETIDTIDLTEALARANVKLVTLEIKLKQVDDKIEEKRGNINDLGREYDACKQRNK